MRGLAVFFSGVIGDRLMFVRFVAGADGADHRSLTGVIREAQALLESATLEAYEEALLDETYAWLDEYLPCPPFRRRRFPSLAKCWFKVDAAPYIARMRDLVAILEEHGVRTRMLTSMNPGKVLYEDNFQIVVVEWCTLA